MDTICGRSRWTPEKDGFLGWWLRRGVGIMYRGKRDEKKGGMKWMSI